MVSIQHSVGQGGYNRWDDVVAIQDNLNRLPRTVLPVPMLATDGKIGPRTISAILEFQRRVVHLANPDGRIDPNGRSLNALRTALVVGGAAPTPSPAPAPVPVAPGAVTYGEKVGIANRIVSSYAIGVIEYALSRAAIARAVITSTIRLPREQAETMYANAVLNLAGQYSLYNGSGDQVLKVYEDNATRPAAEVIDLMTAKIEDLSERNNRVSKHVTTLTKYAALNIIDIGLNSTRAVNPPGFDKEKLTTAFVQLQSEGFIQTFIDETEKTNTCRHLEIVPNVKALP